MAAIREINFGLPPPPGVRKEEFYYDDPPRAPVSQRNQFRNNNIGGSQQQRQGNGLQRRVTFSASTDGDRADRQQQQFDNPPTLPHTSYSPNRVLGLGAQGQASSQVYYYARNYSPAAPGVSQNASPYYSLYSYTSSPYYNYYGTSRYTRLTSTSTATASNLAGPGRNLGRLYSYLGRRLEALMSFLAVSLGFGPDATALRIELAIKQTAEIELAKGLRRPPSVRVTESRKRKLHKLCVRLLEYTDAREFTTQFNALTRLLTIAIIPEVPDRDIARDALAGVQALQWMQMVKRSMQRRRTTYAPEEFKQLCKLHTDVTIALEACARAAWS